METASDMEKPCSTAEVRERLDRTENGGVKNSIKNCLTVFCLDEVLHQSIRYNLFTEKTDIVKPLWWHKRSPVMNETDINYLMLYLEENYRLSVEAKNFKSDFHHCRQKQISSDSGKIEKSGVGWRKAH